MALDQVLETIELLVPLAKAIPVLGSTVEGSLEAVAKIIKYAQDVKRNKSESRDLAEEAARWIQTLVNELQQVDADKLLAVQVTVDELYRTLVEIADRMQRRERSNKVKALWNKSADAEELRRLRVRLKEVFDRFMAAAHIRTHVALSRLVEVQSTLINVTEQDILKALAPIHAARFDSRYAPSGCLANTRTDLLSQLHAWATQSSSQLSIFWLTGLGGTGKTTIAKTLCDRLAGSQQLAATFFASRDSANRRDPFKIIHTFAYELAISQRAVGERVMKAIQTPPEVTARSMREQIERLIARPLANGKLRIKSGSVFSIDALDECDKLDGVEGGQLIPLLANALQRFDIKLFITSRHETTLQDMFRSLQHVSIRLHDIESGEVARDVRLYFQNSFALVKSKRRIVNVDWPAHEHVELLTSRTGHLWIYAVMVVRFVNDINFNPQKRLQQVLERKPLASALPYHLVDSLYVQTLSEAVHTPNAADQAVLCERLQTVLGAIVALQQPQTATTIAGLLALDPYETQASLDRMSAVLLNEPGYPIRIFHPSFGEFLTEADRCRDVRFLIAPAPHHSILARACLVTMNQQLRQDICELRNPTLFNSEVADLPQRLQRLISPELRYACIYWTSHLAQVATGDESLVNELRDFCQTHLLHWLEALSLLDAVFANVLYLPQAVKWCKTRLVSGETAHIAKLLEDTRRVMISFSIPIQASALHVYHSAFVLMPRCLLHETYESSSDAASLCKLCTPRRSHWGFASTVLEGHQKKILHLAWSADSTTLASTSQDDTTRTWDAETGLQRDVLNHPFHLALGLAFLGDEARILVNKASGQAHSSPPEIKSMPLGRLISTLHGDHASKTTMKANLMSSDGTRIGVWSGDSFKSQQTLRIWDTHTGRALFDLSEHSAPVYCCAFSPDSGMIATTASIRDNDLRLWDGKSGRLIRVSGHNNVISSINFSADSSRIASASRENVFVWDSSADGPPIAMLVHSDLQVEAVAFTMDRGRLVSGTMDGNIRLWDVDASSTLCTLRGHTNGVSFLAVSPDNTRLASGSQDGTIRIWDMPTDADAWEANDPEAQQTAHPFGEIAHVTLSPRLEYVAATSSNMLRISRNVGGETGSWVDDEPIHHARRISGVLTSPDGSLLVSVDGQAVARFWNPSTGELLVTLEPASRAHAVHAIRFSLNGDSFTMEQFDQSPTTWMAGKDYPSSSSVALPPQPVPGHHGMVLKPQLPDAGWLYYQNQDQTDGSNRLAEPARLVWVPPELRWGRDRAPSCIAATGSMAVIGGQGGTLTVMDCSKVVAP